MDIQSLRYFIAIAEGGTLSQVANQSYITQPALSRKIQQLENELHCKLFDRSKSSLHLTKQGKAILPIVKNILYLIDDLQSITQDYSHGYNSLLSVGCCGVESSIFYEMVGLIHQQYPMIRIETPKLFSVMDVVEKVLNKEIDCCFMYSDYQYGNDDQLESIPLQETHLQLIVSSSHPFSSVKEVSVTELVGEKLLLWRRDMFPDYHNRLYKGCYDCNVHPNVVGSFTCKQELFSKVAAAEGIAVVHSTDIYHPENAPFAYVDLVMPDGHLFYKGYISLFWSKQNNNPALPLITALARKEMIQPFLEED